MTLDVPASFARQTVRETVCTKLRACRMRHCQHKRSLHKNGLSRLDESGCVHCKASTTIRHGTRKSVALDCCRRIGCEVGLPGVTHGGWRRVSLPCAATRHLSFNATRRDFCTGSFTAVSPNLALFTPFCITPVTCSLARAVCAPFTRMMLALLPFRSLHNRFASLSLTQEVAA